MEDSERHRSPCKRLSYYLKDALSRYKPLDYESLMETPLNRNLSQLDLVLFGVGAMVANTIFGAIEVVAHTYAGSAVFLCFLLAGFACLLNGVCYSELSAHIPRAGSAYVFTYMIAGEFLAFITGWLIIFEYATSVAAVAIFTATNLDLLVNKTISAAIEEHIGVLTTEHSEYLNPYPNFLACAFILIPLIIVGAGNFSTSLVNKILTMLTFSIVAIVTVYMFCHFNPTNFISKDHPNFLPYGFSAFLAGSGVAFASFIGFDSICVAGEEARNPQKAIPKGIILAIFTVIAVSVIHSISVSGYVGWWGIKGELGLANVFSTHSVLWLHYMIAIGAVLGGVYCLVCCTYPIPRIAYSMASDGLLFAPMGWINQKTKVPLIPLLTFGGLAMVLAMFFNFTTTTSFISVGTLISYAIVACDIIFLRYMRFELYLTRDTNEVGRLYPRFRQLKFIHSQSPGVVPCSALLGFIILSCVILIFATDAADYMLKAEVWAILTAIILAGVFIASVVTIAIHRPYNNKASGIFQVPLVPYVPLLTIFINIALIIKLPWLTWVLVIIWIAIGLIIYFAYSIRHSHLSINNNIPGSYTVIPESKGFGADNEAFANSDIQQEVNTSTDERKPIIQKK